MHALELRAPVEAGEASEPIAVYDGRLCVGHYAERAGSWHASSGDHRDLGTYPTREAAIDAIAGASRWRRGYRR
jgi:hypothetical protein